MKKFSLIAILALGMFAGCLNASDSKEASPDKAAGSTKSNPMCVIEIQDLDDSNQDEQKRKCCLGSSKCCSKKRRSRNKCCGRTGKCLRTTLCGTCGCYDRGNKFLSKRPKLRRAADVATHVAASGLANYYAPALVISDFSTDNSAESVLRNIREVFPDFNRLHCLFASAGVTAGCFFFEWYCMPEGNVGLTKLSALATFKQIALYWKEMSGDSKED